MNATLEHDELDMDTLDRIAGGSALGDAARQIAAAASTAADGITVLNMEPLYIDADEKGRARLRY